MILNTRYGLILVFILLFSAFIFTTKSKSSKDQVKPILNSIKKNLKKATLAGGCFWCMEPPYESLPGVYSVVSGYTGGREKNPTYGQVSGGQTTHIESVQIEYDSSQVSFSKILDIFWRNVDPTQDNGQFHDIGPQYRTAIFYHDKEQQKVAEESKRALEARKIFSKPIVTEILPFNQFYVAEEYHQDYYKKNPIRYKLYRSGSGRDRFLSRTWSKIKKKMEVCNTSDKSPACSNKTSADPKLNSLRNAKGLDDAYKHFSQFTLPSKKSLSSKLDSLQFRVTQKNGTEQPFSNQYWDEKRKGIYVDVVSGEPLFSSQDKYDSKTGWPSFSKPIDSRFVKTKSDYLLIIKRTEIRSAFANSHLGHVFEDGPHPTGLRYCINSAALDFIPYKDLDKKGYGFLAQLFN